MSTATVTSAFPTGRGSEATALIFEYMAATQAETGRSVRAGIGDLPAVVQRECVDLQDVYHPPGTLLIADRDGQLVGCVGLAAQPGGRTAEVRRLYVRPACRLYGIAGLLMSYAHHHAARQGMTRLILDVLRSRIAVISFYRHLGYTETGPYLTESPVPMIYMERPITRADIRS
jgi:N-acetylglutamate synthase-like GNAT family acetyltransferase